MYYLKILPFSIKLMLNNKQYLIKNLEIQNLIIVKLSIHKNMYFKKYQHITSTEKSHYL